MWPPERNVPFREFSTPPASWRRPAHSPVAVAPVPMSETRRRFVSPVSAGRDDFHAVHKVPSGDSPYAKAKHVQLVERDPSKAVALFWAAINAGDRVDSALKDMAVVMKQLDRSDEAIEAIKSFRYLCPQDSQESLDNVLIDLYKRAGKVEQEIEMLQQMLKNIDEEIAVFGVSRTKIARSQGKKVQITVVQEKARIIGNLAWAFLQQHNYGFAEQNYRKAMLLEPDKNKQCNLALCLMHMNRVSEAKLLLEQVRTASGGIEKMDESYAKSYERASEMLSRLESGSQGTEQPEEGSLSFPDKLKTQETIKSKSFESAFGSGPSSESPWVGDWRRDCYFESPVARSDPTDRRTSTPCINRGAAEQNCSASSPAAVLYTQPRIDPRRAVICSQKKEAFGPNRVPRPSNKLLSHVGKNNNSATDSWQKPLIVVGDVPVPMQQHPTTTAATKSGASDATVYANENCIQELNFSRYTGKKSWADIAEEEEQEQLLLASKGCNHNDHDHLFNDENVEYNITQMLEGVCLSDSSNLSKTGSGSKDRAVRRSLSFEDDKEVSSSATRTRLQVFRDITPYPESP